METLPATAMADRLNHEETQRQERFVAQLNAWFDVKPGLFGTKTNRHMVFEAISGWTQGTCPPETRCVIGGVFHGHCKAYFDKTQMQLSFDAVFEYNSGFGPMHVRSDHRYEETLRKSVEINRIRETCEALGYVVKAEHRWGRCDLTISLPD